MAKKYPTSFMDGPDYQQQKLRKSLGKTNFSQDKNQGQNGF